MQQVGNHTLIGASGDLSDYQKIIKMVQEMQTFICWQRTASSENAIDFYRTHGEMTEK